MVSIVLVQAIMYCSFSVIQGTRVEISMGASNSTPQSFEHCNEHSYSINAKEILDDENLRKHTTSVSFFLFSVQ
jgi:hypothetical protein